MLDTYTRVVASDDFDQGIPVRMPVAGFPPAEWQHARKIIQQTAFATDHGFPVPPLREFPTLPGRGEVVAYVNCSRWVAECPHSGCSGAEVVTPRDPRFLCSKCDNLGNGWYPVVFPAEPIRARIEQVLNHRPISETRNWLPDETVEDLQIENMAHGVPHDVDGSSLNDLVMPPHLQRLVADVERDASQRALGHAPMQWEIEKGSEG